jgi:hypothetical protein
MLKLSLLAAMAVIGCATLQPVMAQTPGVPAADQPAAAQQTPGAAAAEKSGVAPSLKAGNVALKSTKAAPPAFNSSARLQQKQPATAAAANRQGSAWTQTSAAVASARHARTHSQASATRFASLKPSRAKTAGSNAVTARSNTNALATARSNTNTLATARSQTSLNLRSNRTARASESALAFSPARAAPDVRGRSAAARSKTMPGLSTNGLLPKRPNSG